MFYFVGKYTNKLRTKTICREIEKKKKTKLCAACRREKHIFSLSLSSFFLFFVLCFSSFFFLWHIFFYPFSDFIVFVPVSFCYRSFIYSFAWSLSLFQRATTTALHWLDERKKNKIGPETTENGWEKVTSTQSIVLHPEHWLFHRNNSHLYLKSLRRTEMMLLFSSHGYLFNLFFPILTEIFLVLYFLFIFIYWWIFFYFFLSFCFVPH